MREHTGIPKVWIWPQRLMGINMRTLAEVMPAERTVLLAQLSRPKYRYVVKFIIQNVDILLPQLICTFAAKDTFC